MLVGKNFKGVGAYFQFYVVVVRSADVSMGNESVA